MGTHPIFESDFDCLTEMAKLNIQQETFDNYVKENIEDLEMSPEEAVQDAIETCQVQGGDLYFVIKKNVESDGRHLVLHLVDALLDSATLVNLERFADECRTFECRHFASSTYSAHIKIAEQIAAELDQSKRPILLIRALTVLLKGQPDWVEMFIKSLLLKLALVWQNVANGKTPPSDEDFKFVAAVAKLVEMCSKNHEENRCAMMSEGVQESLCSIFNPFECEFSTSYESALQDGIAALQAQLVDDDKRSEGCQGHQRARSFVVDRDLLSNVIKLTEKLLAANRTSELGNSLMKLISSLLVSADFCNEAAKMGCGELAVNLIRENPENPERVKCALNLVKGLVGNDDVRRRLITQVKVEEDVVIALQRHFGCGPTALAALRAITALTLRNPETARKMISLDGANAIVNALNAHTDNRMLIRAGLMAVRNCVVRSTELRPKFLDLGIEQVANVALSTHNLDEAKACLRDLGCDVKLKEIWTGSGQKLERGDANRLKGLNIT